MATIDKDKVREVILFADNDYRMYEVLTTTYLNNLKKKRLKGTYDKKKSYKLMEYYYQNYVRPEMKKPSKYGYDPKFNKPEKEYFSKYYGDKLWEEFLKNVRPKSKLKGTAKTKRKLGGMRKGMDKIKYYSDKQMKELLKTNSSGWESIALKKGYDVDVRNYKWFKKKK